MWNRVFSALAVGISAVIASAMLVELIALSVSCFVADRLDYTLRQNFYRY